VQAYDLKGGHEDGSVHFLGGPRIERQDAGRGENEGGVSGSGQREG
jgi:hypothetical protein